MSRIGKLPIVIPTGVECSITQANSCLNVLVSGPGGVLSRSFPKNKVSQLCIEIIDNIIYINVDDKKKCDKNTRSMYGTVRSLIYNMVVGVTNGYSLELEITGVGCRASIVNERLALVLGKSHPTLICIPDDIKVSVPKPNIIVLYCACNELLGNFAASIVRERPPDSYSSRDIRYKGRVVQRKQVKKT